MQRAKGAAIADDDLAGDGFKSGAKMLHRFERDDVLAFGLDTERSVDRELLSATNLGLPPATPVDGRRLWTR